MIKIGKHEIKEGRAYERVEIPGGGALMVRGYPRDGVTVETRDEIATGYGDTFQAAADEAVRRVRGYVRDRLRTLRRDAANAEKRIARVEKQAALVKSWGAK